MVVESARDGTHTVGQQLAHDKTEVDVAREDAANFFGTDLGRVGRGDDSVAAEDKAAKELSNEKHFKGAGEELDADESTGQCDTGTKGTLPAISVHGMTGNECADDLADGIPD